MDVFLLHAPVTEYTNQRSLACLTVRSANSLSGSLPRRPGVRKDRASAAAVVSRDVELKERETKTGYNCSRRWARSVDGQDFRARAMSGYQAWTVSCKGWNENKVLSGSTISSNRTQNENIDKKPTDFGINRGRNSNPAFVNRNGTGGEWRQNLPSRSRSVDWKSGASSPDREARRSNIAALLCDKNKARGRDTEGLRGSSTSTFQTYNSAGVSSTSQSNPKISRLKSAPELISDSVETGSFGTKRGQSISERIEKLFGPSKTEDFSKVRDFSSLERNWRYGRGGAKVRHRSVISSLPSSCDGETGDFTSALLDTKTGGSVTSPCPRTRPRLPEGQWEERIYGRYSDHGGVSAVIGSIETMSLDRARSRNTRARQIRSDRAACSKASSQKTSFSGLSETNRIIGTQWEKNMLDKGKTAAELELKVYEDVFDPNLNINGVGWRVHPDTQSPSVSVRNKINQFEALTQKTQTFAKGQNIMPRRAFSVPTRLNTAHDGLKSESEKTGGILGDKSMGLRGLGETDRKAQAKVGQLKSQSQRSLSVDEIGKRFMGDLTKMEGTTMDLVYKCTDVSNYSRFKHTVGSPLKEVRHLYIDEPDSCIVSRDQDRRTNNTESSILLSSSDPEPRPYAELSGIKKAKSPVIIVAVTDDDKTPTNSPNHSPSSSPIPPPNNGPQLPMTENTKAAKNPQREFPAPVQPLCTSSHSKFFPDITDSDLKGKKNVLDLDSWVAGFNAWKQDEAFDKDDDDDDDTEKDDDSYSDSDSGESSVTITSNMSLSDRRSFSLSLAELCHFTGADSESENDIDEISAMGRRSASLSSEVSALSYVSVLPSEELDKLLEDVRSLGDSNLQDDVHVVVLHKEVAVGLGFSIAGGIDQNKPVSVHKVFPTGVAAQEGSIREGDQVLSINGTALGSYTHWEALRVLRRAKTREMGVVVLRRGDVRSISKGDEGQTEEPTQTQTSETGQCMRVHLEKKSRDLGFSLEGGFGLGDKPLTIKKIFQGGPVDKISPGDEVMEIEGVSMVGMRRLEAWALIRGLPSGPVDVVIHRPHKTSEPKGLQKQI
ncbi:uncharacterized protein si:dkey-92i15.4 [Hippocampus zosterae]|uniref:uncharacterized protein si:dkey-92i15.4 n=1 Tax=Hippocampus zosterae TaxID=109293 RepID=UPI00223DA826|nr:uncharacterized protein si:dkey-92i15.4 [Hippocampus zosterae]XP_051922134.1 uncharacterized protein si:dkey-92i15.4 [Hippocampus zosterae]XP_051922135.1 uncharacterized protein si:dkey-92i15.4 [Hippocampus zosterae]XP_051922136.1 uncharacterized protein si:dkey-92i15.4 [Hippocampus zosterae]